MNNHDLIAKVADPHVCTDALHDALATALVDSVRQVAELQAIIRKAVAALSAGDSSPGVPDYNEWADAYRVSNALDVLRPPQSDTDPTNTNERSTN